MERPIVFGTLNNLVGIAHVPTQVRCDQSTQSLGVMMLTPGMLHSAGPFRLHVALAQVLGQQGIPSCRFDLSGIGESLGVGSRGDSIQRAVEETRQAMDVMQKEFGVDRFVLFGLCSGADDSLYVAQADERVIGAVLLDGLGFRTPAYYLRRCVQHYLPKIHSWQQWKKLAHRLFQRNTLPTNSMIGGDDIREFPTRDKAQRLLQSLINRQVSLMLIYTGGARDYFNHERQFGEMFPELNTDGRVNVKLMPQCDHVAFLWEDRQCIIQQCSDWVQSQREIARPSVRVA